jgi:hypothetical protein
VFYMKEQSFYAFCTKEQSFYVFYTKEHTRLIHKVSFPGAVYRNKTQLYRNIYCNRYSKCSAFFSTYSLPELRHLSYRRTNFCILCRRSLPPGIGTTVFWCQLLRHPPGAQFP